MKLSFLPREDALVREAGVHPRIGEATRYYGRSFDAATRGYPANEKPFEVESESEDGQKCARQCRKGALWAANKETAATLNVELVETEFKDGVHFAKPTKAEKAAEPAKATGKPEKGAS